MKKIVLATAAVIALSSPAFAAGSINQQFLNVQDLQNTISLSHNGDGPVLQEITNTANIVAATVGQTSLPLGNVEQYAGFGAKQLGSNSYDTQWGMWNNSDQSIANTLNVALADSLANVTQTSNAYQKGTNYVEFGQSINGGVANIVESTTPSYPQSVRNTANVVDASNLANLTQSLSGAGQHGVNTVNYVEAGTTYGSVQNFGQELRNTANVALLSSTNFSYMSQTANAPQTGINTILGNGALDHVRQTAANVANVFSLPSAP